jgi:hypothetical protein
LKLACPACPFLADSVNSEKFNIGDFMKFVSAKDLANKQIK